MLPLSSVFSFFQSIASVAFTLLSRLNGDTFHCISPYCEENNVISTMIPRREASPKKSCSREKYSGFHFSRSNLFPPPVYPGSELRAHGATNRPSAGARSFRKIPKDFPGTSTYDPPNSRV